MAPPPVANRLSTAVPMITPLSHLTAMDSGQYGNAYLWFESISLQAGEATLNQVSPRSDYLSRRAGGLVKTDNLLDFAV